jgi:hypothetical protein
MPKNEAFDEFFFNLSWKEPNESENFSQIEVVPERLQSDEVKKFISKKVSIWYYKNSTIKLDSVLIRISEILRNNGHHETALTSKIILALVCLMNKQKDYAEYIDYVIGNIVIADTSMYLIAPFLTFPGFKSYEIENFSIGKINIKRVIYQCKKVGCDYFDKYSDLKNKLKDRFSVSLSFSSTNIINLHKITRDFEYYSDDKLEVMGQLGDYYFELVTECLKKKFYDDFYRYQEPLVAYGAPYLDLNMLDNFTGCDFYTVYQNIDNTGKGYFCPFVHTPVVNFPDLGDKTPSVIKELKEKFDFSEIKENSEIHQTIKSYCTFVMKAIICNADEKYDEAFLNYVIALDLLFGEKDSSNATVSNRTAIVTYQILNNEFSETLKKTKKLYDIRSNYVHKGKRIDKEYIDEIEPIIREVYCCLLRLQSDPKNEEKVNFFDSWFRQLDYLVKAVEASKEIKTQEFIDAGIYIEIY